jgi:predicted nucleotidyltransferase
MVSMNHIRQAVETVAPAFPIKKVELFGSYASGTAQEHSDADFLVEFNESPFPPEVVWLSGSACRNAED